MNITEVTSRKTENKFLDVPRILYKNDPGWVCQPDGDIRRIFDPSRNRNFRQGEACRWILSDDEGRLTGRIAAFYSKGKNSTDNFPSGGAGFFECTDDQASANLLFDTAREWLKVRGLKAMDAPVNFGENDSYWGLLTEGFMPQAMGMPYNFPYYRELFENYGFRLYFRQYTFHLDLTVPFPERFWKIADWIEKRPGYSFRHFSWKESDKFIKDAAYIYDTAWSVMKEDFVPLDPGVLRETMRGLKPVIDGELIWFAYYNDEPIAFFIMMPDVNQILKKLNGKLHFFNIMRFLYYRETGTVTRIRALAAGVIPKFQNSGVESGIFRNLGRKLEHKPQYKEIDMSWVGDYNPKMLSLYRNLGGVKTKTHFTMRYMIDPSIPFERFMGAKIDTELLRQVGETEL